MFKVPEIPRKIRKVTSTDTREMPSNEIVDALPPNQNPPETNCPPPQKELNALFDTFIEKNTTKLTDCVRTIVNGMFHEFWDAAQPMQSQLQSLKTQLSTMQAEHTREIDELKRQKNSLKQKLNTLTGKYDAQSVKLREAMQKNAELDGIHTEAKLKMAAVTMELKKTIER